MVIGGRYTLRCGESGLSRLAWVAGDLLMAAPVRRLPLRWKCGIAASGCDFGQPVSNALFAPRQSQKTVSKT
jgi:hypothetical protein